MRDNHFYYCIVINTIVINTIIIILEYYYIIILATMLFSMTVGMPESKTELTFVFIGHCLLFEK